MTKQKVLIAGLAAAVLCAVCLGVVLGSKNAALKAQVDALAEENAELSADVETLTQDNEKHIEAWREATASANRYAEARTRASDELEKMEKQMAELQETLEDELEDAERQNRQRWQEKLKWEENWAEAELELASLRQTSFSDEIVLAALDKYYDFQAVIHFGPVDLVVVAGLVDSQAGMEHVYLSDGDVKDGVAAWSDVQYCATGVTEEDFRNALLRYMSERCYENEFEGWTEVCDGYIYIPDVGATGFGVETISVERVRGSYYHGVMEYIWIDDSRTRFEVEFGVENVDGNCVISVVKTLEE